MTSETTYTCPVCGCDQLEKKPYPNMPPISAALYTAQPPYEKLWGMASYEVCPCCGFEFGNDDNAGTGPNSSFSEYLGEWIVDEKMQWLIPELKPANWNLADQLKKAGIPIDDETLRRMIQR